MLGEIRMYFVRVDVYNFNSILLVYRYLQIYFTYHIYICIDLSILNFEHFMTLHSYYFFEFNS